MPDLQIYEGPDRIEFSARMGRPMRQGSWKELEKSDFDCVKSVIDSHNAGLAPSYITYYHFGYHLMTDIGFDWILNWVDFLARRRSRGDALGAAGKTLGMFEEALKNTADPIGREQAGLLLKLYHSEVIDMESAENYWTDKGRAGERIATAAREPVNHLYEELLRSLEAGDFSAASSLWEDYFVRIRWLHDHLFHLSWIFGSSVYQLFGQETAQVGVGESLTGCSFYEVAWKASSQATPTENAAALAEHLRAHFSGPGRTGSVGIIEEKERYRLVLDPCGSGGALRRRFHQTGTAGLEKFSDPSPYTWGRRGEVPIYCSHCAKNELESMRRLGYPLWVAEFDPNPQKPCGWTVYKDPDLIPDMFFNRLGYEKDPSRFIRLPIVEGNS